MLYKNITMYIEESILCKNFIIDLINFSTILQTNSTIKILPLSANYNYFYNQLLHDIQQEILYNYFFNGQTNFYICFEKKYNETRFIILPSKSSFPYGYLTFEKTKTQLFTFNLQQTKIMKKILVVVHKLASYDKYNTNEKQKNFLKFLKITKDISYCNDPIIYNNILEPYIIHRNIKFNFFKKLFFETICKEVSKQFRIIFNDNAIQLSATYKPAYKTTFTNLYENKNSLSQIITYYFS